MEYQKKEVHLGEGDKDVVELDKNSPRFQRARELMTRMVLAERTDMLAKAQVLDLRQSGLDDSVSDLWSAMPRVAKEHEVSLAEGSDEPLRAEQPEDQGEVSAC